MENNNEMIVKKNKNLIIIGILAIVVIVVLVVFLLINNKTVKPNDEPSSSNQNNEVKTLDLESDLVKGLVKPTTNIFYKMEQGEKDELSWDYYDFNVSDLHSDLKKMSAISISEWERLEDYTYVITEEKIKENYQKMFGPADPYIEGPFRNGLYLPRRLIYREEKKVFEVIMSENATADYKYWTIEMPFKAEMKDDEISVYYHYLYVLEDTKKTAYYNKFPTPGVDFAAEGIEIGEFTPIKDKVVYVKTDLLISNEEVIEKLAKEDKTSEYKYTYKKQADGNYYFLTGKVIK